MADISNVTIERGGEHGKKERGKSKDVLSSLESRLVRMEKAVGDIAGRLEEEIPTNETLEAFGEELKGELQGALNSMLDAIRKEVQEKLDHVMAEVTSIQEEMKVVRGDWALCKEAVLNKGHVVHETLPRVEAPKPKSFDGKRDAKELDTFLWNVERYLHHLRIDDDATKISTTSLYLTDNALLWWHRRSGEIERGTFTLETWSAFKEDLKLHFYPSNARFEAKEKLRWLKHLGSVRDYVAEFTNLLFEVSDMTEEDKFVYFMSGLQPWAKTELQRRTVQNLSQAIAAAESLIELKRVESKEEVDSEDNHTNGGGDKEAKTKSDGWKSSAMKRNFGDKGRDQSKPLACYFCDGPHIMRDCPRKKSINAMVAQLEGREIEEKATMSSLCLLNAVKASDKPGKNRGKGLMYVNAIVNGKTSQALVDTGANHNFVSIEEARRLGLKYSREDGKMKAVNSGAKPIEGVAYGVKLQLGEWSGKLDLTIIPMDDYDMVIGTDFMDKVKAFPIPYSNSLIITEKGSTYTVPMVRQGRTDSKLLSGMQYSKGVSERAL